MQKKYINAWWWRSEINFGDVLTPYIIEHLSGMECKFIGYHIWNAFTYILKHLWAHIPIDRKDFTPTYICEPKYILGVGSILQHKGHGKAIAWGSGFIRQSSKFYGEKATAVRGKYSSDRLVELGHPRVIVVGDPALLLPLLYKAKINKNNSLAIVPNFSEFHKFKKKYGAKYDIINLNTDEIETTIDIFCSYKFVLSTSLHGLILSHAYGIPAIWIEDSVLAGDTFHFKYRDYFSSVGIEYYEPYHNIDELLDGDVEKFFELNKEKYTLKRNLFEIQKQLINVAPFPVLDKYKSIQ